MKPDREQCLKWAEDSCHSDPTPVQGELILSPDEIEALCRTVWNAAIEEAAKNIRDTKPGDATDAVSEAFACFVELLKETK